MNLSTNKITFLRDVYPSVNVDMNSGWRFHYFENFQNEHISTYIKSIADNKIYLLIPLFVSSISLENPRLYLSSPFLVNNESNPALISKFIVDQWYSSPFVFREGTDITFSFKFKRVWFSSK
jgi:hypothetical protein